MARFAAAAMLVMATAIAGLASPAAAAQQEAAIATPQAQAGCGFNYDETYVHCDARTRVRIDARNFWGTTYRDICVGYGSTYLGNLSYWRIVNAWYNGKLC